MKILNCPLGGEAFHQKSFGWVANKVIFLTRLMGRAAAFDFRDQQFESQQRHIVTEHFFDQLLSKKIN